MDMQTQHTLRAFDDDLTDLRDMIAEIGALADTAIGRAIRALSDGDELIARRLIEDDKAIDALAQRIDQKAVETIALRAPMAADLRDIVAALKIAWMIERIGDYAKNVAKRVPDLSDAPEGALAPLVEMGDTARRLLASSLKGFRKRDEGRAAKVDAKDDALDKAYSELVHRTVEGMSTRGEDIAIGSHLLFVGKYLERIGDQATNIAEIVYFAATGEEYREMLRRSA